MKLRLDKVEKLNQAFNILSNAKLKGTKALEVYKFKLKLNEMTKFFLEKKQSIIERYGVLSDDKTKYNFSGDNLIKAEEEFAELCAIEEEFTDFSINISELNLDELEVTPNFFIEMGNLIK